ncbi:hypothetical protein N5853_09410 [Bartonella sp. HY329]|uniref:hypothetical protein n=1 Tax=unclassified Bartonella TaxID=2645622 RepID=UPI0021C8FE6D|nr:MULTISPECIES: hypothetical protein [unclassified Bartonella]UXM94324.1 hypothetical protein N5853_09410 [Bartonella sp. HY329]UXN08647.1 hypothetical protein N5852_09420 [Bartonella sp. HY328]
MKFYAEIDETTVKAVLSTDKNIFEYYHPDFAKNLVLCNAEVQAGWSYDGKSFKAPIIQTPELEVVQKTLKQLVDENAEKARLKYITPGVGQSMTYQEKVNQAANYAKAYAAHLKDPDSIKAPNENEYLLLKSSLGIDGDTLAEVAENITWAYALWEQVGAAIETIRLQTKASIDTATTVEQAQAIFDAVKWP